MPTKKRPPQPPKTTAVPPWQVILEEVRSQNRATIEEVQTARQILEERIERADRESRERDALQGAAIGRNSADIRDLAIGQTRLDARLGNVEVKLGNVEARLGNVEAKLGNVEARLGNVEAKIDRLVPLEERVVVLERRHA